MNHPCIPFFRLARNVAAAAALCASAIGGTAHAQTTTQQPAATQPAQIIMGVIDSAMILNTSKAGTSLNTQWNAAMKSLTDDFDKKEGVLRTQAQQLEAARNGNPPISPADYAKKRQAIEQQSIQLQQTAAKNKKAWDARLDKARETVANAARKAMQEVAEQRGLTVVIDRSAVPYFPIPMNITEEVLARLNKALPNIKL